ncbi:MAG: DNA translocase FtsK [Bacteroidetes bacterium]|uniref:DNA translocase FtsK n=1 Tax=Candidatus Gallipaludibacter merdavium TaxID=2840839 RepID=A0A9D9N3Z8_9BACT|nr:DNA translocase FtsK [Candidatus Gallipaludibacter merdavium]
MSAKIQNKSKNNTTQNQAKSKNAPQKPKSSTWGNIKHWYFDERVRFVFGLIVSICGFYLLVAFISFFSTGAADQSIMEIPQWREQSEMRTQIKNWTGVPGAILAQFFIDKCFGISAFAIAIFIFLAGLNRIKLYKRSVLRLFIQCFFWLIWSSIAIAFTCNSFYASSFFYWGGEHGHIIAQWLNSYIKPLGTALILLSSAIIFSTFTYRGTLPFLKKCGHKLLALLKPSPKPQIQITETEAETKTATEANVAVGTEIVPEEWVEEEPTNEVEFEMNGTDKEESETNLNDFVIEPGTSSEKEDEKTIDKHTEPILQQSSTQEKTVVLEVDKPLDTEEGDPYYNIKNLGKYDPTLDLSHYQFPTLDLLKTYPNENTPIIDMAEQNANKDKIVKTLHDYGIDIESIRATVGPTITLYEIVPKAGIRISKIRNLESDIMLSLAATGIRIIAPIPGKGTIGIEVPNEKPQIVSMHSVIASKKFQEEAKFALPVALGRTITNEVFMFDLAKTPHLLVAGATGQGKSVGLNAIITSLLYKKHPSQLKFVLVDPKMVEFNIYAALEKHYMAKMPDSDNVIITDSTKVIQTLNSLVVEMEERYKLLMQAHCRNITEYNEKFINRQLNPTKGHRFLPYIVIVIDEFGDLIMVAGKEIEMPISRITQKARAVGMHMILATQRPSVNIITGVIKANVPSRIAFRVSSSIDSRTILDAPGANQLVGKGDLLYSGGNDLVRVQCAFVDTPEVEKIVNYISQQQSYPEAYILPEYVAEGEPAAPGTVDLSKRDVMFEQIARWVVAQQQGSTSAIQRTFEIGYNRAGRISDQLEAAGIVSANNGSKGRQVLVQDDYTLTQILEGLK